MLLTFMVLLFGLKHRANCINTTTHTSTNKDIELVNFLKQDLGKNYDDIFAKLPIDKFKISKLLTAINKQSPQRTDKIIKKIAKTNVEDKVKDKTMGQDFNRRNLDLSDSKIYNKYSSMAVTNYPSIAVPMIYPNRFKKVTQTTEYEQSITMQKPIPTSENNAEKFNKAREEKKYKFMEKNKDLLQNFLRIKNKEEAQTEPMPTLGSSLEDIREKMQEPQSNNARLRAIPEQRQLDMSPAKGGRVHALRQRGHFCARNVLMPEGPKYNSKGKIYLPAFIPSRDDYPNTKEPKLVLPKCCNCCKKSVLGCE